MMDASFDLKTKRNVFIKRNFVGGEKSFLLEIPRVPNGDDLIDLLCAPCDWFSWQVFRMIASCAFPGLCQRMRCVIFNDVEYEGVLWDMSEDEGVVWNSGVRKKN